MRKNRERGSQGEVKGTKNKLSSLCLHTSPPLSAHPVPYPLTNSPGCSPLFLSAHFLPFLPLPCLLTPSKPTYPSRFCSFPPLPGLTPHSAFLLSPLPAHPFPTCSPPPLPACSPLCACLPSPLPAHPLPASHFLPCLFIPSPVYLPPTCLSSSFPYLLTYRPACNSSPASFTSYPACSPSMPAHLVPLLLTPLLPAHHYLRA